MKLTFSILLIFIFPFVCLSQNKKRERISSKRTNQTKTLSFLKPEGGGYYDLPNIINGKTLLKDYANFNNKSDTIYLEKVLGVYNSKSGGFLFGNMGPHYGLMLSFKYFNGKEIMVDTCERTDYLVSLKRKEINRDVFLIAKTNHVDQCGQEDFCIIYHSLPYGGLENIFEDYSKLEYYESSPNCATGDSYSQNFHFLLRKGKTFLRVTKIIDSSGKKTNYYYLYHNDKFTLCSKCYQ